MKNNFIYIIKMNIFKKIFNSIFSKKKKVVREQPIFSTCLMDSSFKRNLIC